MKRKFSIILLVLLVMTIAVSSLSTSASVTNKTISLMGIIHSDGADRTSWITSAALNIQGVRNTSVSTFKGFTSSEVLSQFNNQDMVVIHTHGSQSSLLAYKDDSSTLVTTQMIDLPFAADAFSQLRICFVGACSCGAGGSSAVNVVNTIYDQGALCVIGYQNSVTTSRNRHMLQQFCYYIGCGYSVANALTKAQQDVFNTYGDFGGVDNRLVRGISAIAMTDSSYKTIGISTYSLKDYSCQSVNLSSNDVIFADEFNVCNRIGDMYSFNEKGEIYSYTKLILDDKKSSTLSFDSTTFFNSFNLEGYKLEVTQYSQSVLNCMRAYINDLKTNDIIYYTTDTNGDLLSYGYPRAGAAKEVQKEFSDITIDKIINYVNQYYNIYDIEDIIIDVADINNPIADISYKTITDGYECIETLNIPLSKFKLIN